MRIVVRAVAALFALLATTACATVLNSGRPSYNGPTATPIWHAGDLRVTETPVVGTRVVFAVGQEWRGPARHAFAYDLRTGKRLWMAPIEVTRIAGVSPDLLFVGDTSGATRALDTRSGKPARFAVPPGVVNASYDDGTYYAVTESSLRALGQTGAVVWKRDLPVRIVGSPLGAGNSVYVYGLHHIDEMTPEVSGVYAFDRRGAALWKREWREHFGKYRYDSNAKEMRWMQPAYKPSIGPVLADASTAYIWETRRDQRVFVYATVLWAIDARTGRTKWQRSGGPCLDPPTLIENDAILACDGPRASDQQGTRYVALRRSDGVPIWRGETTWNYERSVPFGRFLVVSDRRVHELLNENMQTSPDSWLTLVDRQSGREVWRTPVEPLADFTLPAVGDGTVVVGSTPFYWAEPHAAGSPEVAGLWAWQLHAR